MYLGSCLCWWLCLTVQAALQIKPRVCEKFSFIFKQIPLLQLQIVWIYCPSSGQGLKSQSWTLLLWICSAAEGGKKNLHVGYLGCWWCSARRVLIPPPWIASVNPHAMTLLGRGKGGGDQADAEKQETSSPTPYLHPCSFILVTWVSSI